MANISLNFLWEAFASASGIPPSVLHTDPGHKFAVVQPDENRILHPGNEQDLPSHGLLSGRKL